MSQDVIAIEGSPLSAPEPLLAALLTLNNAHEVELSRLDAQDLRRLVDQAYRASRIGHVEAFLISFDHGADYAGVNFCWFRERYARFVYVDRIVVAPSSRGLGHGRRLYADLIARARRDGHDRIVCEVNAAPPNPASDAFHAAFGFESVGEAWIHGGAKRVRYLSRSVRHGAAPRG